ncbi:MAG: hypothetical protein AUJ23_01135 [Candidatus Magasanikbacteria bacterium CG1_02_32_51]|uniref:Class I SAM-dependent methyltransferase n=2 Tax=Candidatus Magasanikiibacteriota TaxID=1752731 RepID=A0A1J4U9E0_9BACT|nr:MAG: hypothetical protein AUJ23_01135 [Candidatus Magasanikbacteria bacterium CG1_02_32_51]
MIKKILKKFISGNTRGKMREMEKVVRWYLSGKSVSTPGLIKQRTLKKIGIKHNIRIFVETGTAGGGTVDALKKYFTKVYSIEIDDRLFNNAKNKFFNDKNVEILHGDSGVVLTKLMQQINEPALFWLDGHYSGENTGRGSLETPIMSELNAIFEHNIKNHIILIDDARCFDGTNDYPKIEELKDFIKQKNPNFNIEIKNDILIIK